MGRYGVLIWEKLFSIVLSIALLLGLLSVEDFVSLATEYESGSVFQEKEDEIAEKEQTEMLFLSESENDLESAKNLSESLKDPRIVSDSSMKAGQKVTWDCIWFGSYPQAEVIQSSNYTSIGSKYLQAGDIIVNDIRAMVFPMVRRKYYSFFVVTAFVQAN